MQQTPDVVFTYSDGSEGVKPDLLEITRDCKHCGEWVVASPECPGVLLAAWDAARCPGQAGHAT